MDFPPTEVFSRLPRNVAVNDANLNYIAGPCSFRVFEILVSFIFTFFLFFLETGSGSVIIHDGGGPEGEVDDAQSSTLFLALSCQ